MKRTFAPITNVNGIDTEYNYSNSSSFQDKIESKLILNIATVVVYHMLDHPKMEIISTVYV